MNKFFLLTIMHFPLAYSKTIYVSLGYSCGPALALRNLNLRTEAYPFDWIISPFEALYNALDTNFEYFLSNLISREDHIGAIDHYGFHFVHDWPAIANQNIDSFSTDSNSIGMQDWAEILLLVKEKYRRRIGRFEDLCNNRNHLVFIRYTNISKEQAVLLKNLIRNKYPALSFKLIIIYHDINFKDPWNIDYIQNFYRSEWNDPQTLNDVLNEIEN